MEEELIVLFEWLSSNGIIEVFEEKIEGSSGYTNTNRGKNLSQVVSALIDQQNEILKSTDIYNSGRQIRELADSANSIEEILYIINNVDVYENLRKLATNTVVMNGPIDSKIMIINDLPDDKDDMNGSIFSGKSGVLASKIFCSLGIDLNNICLLNTFFWRLPGNRVPIFGELHSCKPIVEKIISIVKPKFIIFCGNYSVSTLLEQNKTVTNTRGKILDYSNCYLQYDIKCITIYNINFLVKNFKKKKDTWNDLLKIRELLYECL